MSPSRLPQQQGWFGLVPPQPPPGMPRPQMRPSTDIAMMIRSAGLGAHRINDDDRN